MNNLAPRQGIFAIILLVSFCLHVLMLMFSIEKQQYDYRTDKGEKIVEQLSKEAMVALANQDRISLSVLTSRYQVDSDVARLVISDQNKQVLVQTGQSQTESGQVIDKPIIQNNQVLGNATITMKAISKGEIVSGQWLYILGSAILHGFLWLIYGYMARPTVEQLARIGEKVQQRIAIARGQQVGKFVPIGEQTDLTTQSVTELDNTVDQPSKSINDFLQPQRSLIEAAYIANHNIDTIADEEARQPIELATISKPEIALQVCFFDEFNLLPRVAPEMAQPYLELCQDLLARACHSLFGRNSTDSLRRYIRDVEVKAPVHFTDRGAVVHLIGREEQLPLASVLLAKLILILNQVVYEKHRELSRFALPMTIGASFNQQFDDMHRLIKNYGAADGMLLLYPQADLKTLNGKVELKNLSHPTNLVEREMVSYLGLAENLMTELIKKRDNILTANDQASANDW